MDATMKDAWLKIITRAWSEPAFKARLLADTNDVLREYGIKVAIYYTASLDYWERRVRPAPSEKNIVL